MVLPADQKSLFFETGILHLKNFVPRKKTEAAKAAILAELDRLKLRVGGKFVTSKVSDLPIFQQINAISQKIKIDSELRELLAADLVQVVEALAGLKSKLIPATPQLLVSFPHKEEWSTANLNWHLDMKVPDKDEITGIQAFILIDAIQPKGGATLVLAGSHRRKFEPRDEKIVEMVGNAGDVYLMDMRTQHSPSINSSKNLRMMATVRYLK